jgi:hypothetical protein
MLMDKQNLLADQQSLIHAAGTWNSDNIIDLWGGTALPTGPVGQILPDFAKGEDVEILCQITETFLAAAGAATVEMNLICADNADLTGNPIVVDRSGAIAKADLVAGYQFKMGCPIGGMTRRYLGIQITIATNPGTAGKFTAGVIVDRQTNP